MRADRATSLRPFDLRSAPMRAFHFAWGASFLGVFALATGASLLKLAQTHLALDHEQTSALEAGALTSALLAPLITGWFCDRVGPRRTHTVLLVLAGLPLLLTPLACSFEVVSLLGILLVIASGTVVVASAHTARMMTTTRVGLAITIGAGAASLGAVLAWLTMPALASAASGVVGDAWGWRVVPMLPGALLLGCALVGYRVTQDQPEGDQRAIERARRRRRVPRKAILAALRDPRLWLVAAQYGACVGVEVALDRAVLRELGDHRAAIGCVALGCLASRAIGGWLSDEAGGLGGRRGRHAFLAAWLALQGTALVALSMLDREAAGGAFYVASAGLVALGAGASLSLAPFVAPRAVGMATGSIVSFGPIGVVATAFALGAADGTGFVWLGLATIALAALTPLVLGESAVLAPEVARARSLR